MSLQRRLILFFVVIVVVPLAAAGFIVQRLVVEEVGARSAMALGPALDAVSVLFNERSEALPDVVRNVIEPRLLARRLASDDPEHVDAFLEEVLPDAPHVDFLVVSDAGGRILGGAFDRSYFVDGFERPSAEELAESGPVGRGFTKVDVPFATADGREGTIIAGFWLDRAVLVGTRDDDIDLSLSVNDTVIASTLGLARPVRVSPSFGDEFETTLDEEVTARARPIGAEGRVAVLASTSHAPGAAISGRVLWSILGLLILAIAATSILAFMLARLITRPLEELALGAEAVSEGKFDHRIPVRSRDEVGRVAIAFNEMTGRLRETITELHNSRDLLQRAVRRVGETLRSTHDMTQMLEAILDTAADAVNSDAAVLWRFTPNRHELYPAHTRGMAADEAHRMRVGEGVAGLVAERAVKVILPSTSMTVRASRNEPAYPMVVAVPLYSRERVVGVITVYRRDEARPFTTEDLDAVFFLAEQGGVAIENVLLHEEARRLSLTDGLTGLYNRRYFQMQFRQLLATAVRFERPFSILMLDLDHFKVINDLYGHQRGDAILIEFAERVSGTLREIDTFARYGGEEFIALLPETGLAGGVSTAQKILEVIRNQPFGGGDEDSIDLTVSIGIACFPDHGESFATLVEAADQALYVAKQEGRDRAASAGAPPSGLRLA